MEKVVSVKGYVPDEQRGRSPLLWYQVSPSWLRCPGLLVPAADHQSESTPVETIRSGKLQQNNGSYLANDPHAFDVIGRQGLDLRRPLQEPLGLGYP